MRGFWYTLEAVIAGIILIGFLIGYGTVNFHSEQLTESRAFEILQGLDNQGLLRQYAVVDDYSSINSMINTTYSHSVEICDSLCVGEKPNESNVYVGRYFVSGDDSLNPKEVRLYLWI